VNLYQIAKHHLSEMVDLATSLDKEQYTASPEIFFGASVGKHYRHIIEFYQSFINGIPSRVINYDKRERNVKIENDLDYCIETIKNIENQLDELSAMEIIPVEIEYEYDGKIISSVSSTNRELIFCIEHCVHHLAILKLGIHSSFKNIKLPENLGVAHSTVQYMQKAAKQ